jgi:hypothetical protein
MTSYQLSVDERAELADLVDDLVAAKPDVEDSSVLADLSVRTGDLPRGLRAFATAARLAEEPLVRVRGWTVADDELGPTPDDWRSVTPTTELLHHQVTLLLFAGLFGDVFSFAALQDGHVTNHVLPIRGAEASVTAGSSRAELRWHTEGAGQVTRAHHQAFVCLRNLDRVPTTIAWLDPSRLPPDVLEVLREPRFHTDALGPDGTTKVAVPVVSGPDERPYLRIDPVYMTAGDDDAARALTAVTSALDAAIRPFHQEPGDLYVIDNFRAVHGRPAFTARYDGRDRWLLRVMTTRDLRVSARHRSSAAARVIQLRR